VIDLKRWFRGGSPDAVGILAVGTEPGKADSCVQSDGKGEARRSEPPPSR
jgi:hypothetical protein